MSDNRDIYNTRYTEDNVSLVTSGPYDDFMINLRFSLIREFGAGRDVLDLCCGTGSFLIPMLGIVKSAVGLDFSSNMLDGFRRQLGGPMPGNLKLVEADASSVPFRDEIFDFVYSYTALYNVPDLAGALNEVGRVLRRGGHAALELGNCNSLAMVVDRAFHEQEGWAIPYMVPLRAMGELLNNAGLSRERRYSFQLLPMFGAPRTLGYLKPLATPRWKKIMGVQLGGRMLDQWVSGAWPFRHFAFRHLFVVHKP